jgi:hypothetical protein
MEKSRNDIVFSAKTVGYFRQRIKIVCRISVKIDSQIRFRFSPEF